MQEQLNKDCVPLPRNFNLLSNARKIYVPSYSQSNQSELRQNSNARNRNYNFQHIFLKVSYLFADPDRIRKIAFIVTNEKDSCSAFQNNNKRYYRPRSFHRLYLNVARTIAISLDERGDAFQFTLINFYVYARPSIRCLYFIYARKIYVCTYVNFTRHRKLTLCTLGLLGYTDRKESANEKRRKESEGPTFTFLRLRHVHSCY